MREFIRHPSDIPIEISRGIHIKTVHDQLKDISEGGLSFTCRKKLEIGDIVTIKIPIRTPPFKEKAQVVWLKQNGDFWETGVTFVDSSTDFRLRMIEQVCYIEHYKREILATEGRQMNGAQAAEEWVKKYAGSFPR